MTFRMLFVLCLRRIQRMKCLMIQFSKTFEEMQALTRAPADPSSPGRNGSRSSGQQERKAARATGSRQATRVAKARDGCPKMVRTCSKMGPNNVPKLAPAGPKIAPWRPPGGLWRPWVALGGPRQIFERFWSPFGVPFGIPESSKN